MRRRMLCWALIAAMLTTGIASAEGLEKGSRGKEVVEIQNRLIDLGFLAGSADGIYGAKTEKAVAAFQEYLQSEGLREAEASGELDQETIAYLNSDAIQKRFNQLKSGSRGDEVTALQNRLIELGFLSGTADGRFGKSTEKAVRAFQEYMNAHGRSVEENGVADEKTLEALLDPTFSDPAFRLEEGVYGSAVEALQERLNELGLLPAYSSGEFGDRTRTAVEAFQTYRIEKKGETGVVVDGVVDYETIQLLYDEDYCDSLYDVGRGSRGDLVAEVQERLCVLGFMDDAGDGEFGASTEEALKAYQQCLMDRGMDGVEMNGIADSATRAILFDESVDYYLRDLEKGDRSEETLRVQRRLNLLGYTAGGVDGVYGEKTVGAMKVFQKGAKLPETGVADHQTQSALFSQQAQPSDLVILKELKSGSKGVGVTRLQERLAEFGFLTGKVDGSYGKKTRAAVMVMEDVLSAQGTENVVKNGIASVAEQEAFFSEEFIPYVQIYRQGDSGVGVYCVKERLLALNDSDLTPDDNFDAHSAKALARFQERNGLAPTGVIDRQTVTALYSAEAIAADFALRRDLKAGDKGESVRDLEDVLSRLGFLAGLPDAKFDGETTKALSRLRAYLTSLEDRQPAWAQWITRDDAISADAQEQLLRADIPVYQRDIAANSDSEDILRVQHRLYSLYYMGHRSDDGQYGETTRDAVVLFQKTNGLAQTGIADEETQNLLFSREAATNPMPYYLMVSLDDQRVYALRRQDDGTYERIREMKCSTGIRDGSTPRGVFVNTWPQERWHYFKKFFCWAQYTYVIYLQGDILFHSVLYHARSEKALTYSSLYNLGRRASHGCVRLSVDDARWVYENCPKGTPVIIY